MSKLWKKSYDLDPLVERFTVGDDHLLDLLILPSDCVASLAHATGLGSIGILTDEELGSIKRGIVAILKEFEKGELRISPHDEDCHTTIENRLTELSGEAGRKIHTGRSRNDQVLTAIRLFGKRMILEILSSGCELVETLLQLGAQHADVPMPGRTHMQVAMPSSIGLWAGAWVEELLDGLQNLRQCYVIFDQSPLGSAASYGTPLPLDRELTARLLGFSKVQSNVLYANNSRGKLEGLILSALEYIGISLSSIAQDILLFSLPEFGYFSLPSELCSGSSIMPQKKNPDVLELIRSRSATLSGYARTVRDVQRSLPSGYNRDLQDTKAPFLKGVELSNLSLKVMALSIGRLEIHRQNLRDAFTDEIFATHSAMELVQQGVPFRDAYREVGLSLESGSYGAPAMEPEEVILKKTHVGGTGTLKLECSRKRVGELRRFAGSEIAVMQERLNALMGTQVELLSGFSAR